MTPWYTIRNRTDTADVEITGEIRLADAHRLIAGLPRNARTIRLRISSLGGDPVAGVQIANALRSHPARVEVTIAKIAASAATLPVMAGDHVRISADAAAMIHAPRMIVSEDTPLTVRRLRQAATELEGVQNSIARTYAWRLKRDAAAIARLVDADTETWLDPAECVAWGIADEVIPAAPAAAARFAPSAIAALGRPPSRFAALVAALATTQRASASRAPVIDHAAVRRHWNRQPDPASAKGAAR